MPGVCWFDLIAVSMHAPREGGDRTAQRLSDRGRFDPRPPSGNQRARSRSMVDTPSGARTCAPRWLCPLSRARPARAGACWCSISTSLDAA